MGNPFTLWRSFLALPNDHPVKIVGMAFFVGPRSCSHFGRGWPEYFELRFGACRFRGDQGPARIREASSRIGGEIDE